MKISSNFDSGNIEVLAADSPDNIRLNICYDAGGMFFQWFHFRVSGVKGQALIIAIENAGKAAYAKGWENYRACVSYDRETWFRTQTDYDGEELTIRHQAEADSLYFAYFAPYSMERHQDRIARLQLHPLVRHEVLGQTLDGQDMDLLILGDASAPLKFWAIARQHPGETMAEWWMEGFSDRLLDGSDAVSRALLDQACFYLVPNMNPDGSRRGYLRTNAVGANLNREWQSPTLTRSPEVYLVDAKMRQTGLDFCLDVHGDENLPYNFIASADSIPNITDKLIRLRVDFENALERANPDFQQEFGYPAKGPGEANMTMGAAHIASTHNALAMTLEMPFKDNDNMPDYFQGWSPARSQKLGASCLDALYAILPDIKDR